MPGSKPSRVIRCRFSERGKAELRPRYPDRLGRMSPKGLLFCTVVWDGRATPEQYAKHFIERAPARGRPGKQPK